MERDRQAALCNVQPQRLALRHLISQVDTPQKPARREFTEVRIFNRLLLLQVILPCLVWTYFSSEVDSLLSVYCLLSYYLRSGC